jgi:hypothetical protein
MIPSSSIAFGTPFIHGYLRGGFCTLEGELLVTIFVTSASHADTADNLALTPERPTTVDGGHVGV